MKINFACENCRSEFSVDEKLAGRAGRCKKCGQRFVIPVMVAVGNGEPGPRRAPDKVTGMDRRAAPGAAKSRGWLDAVTSQVGLAPITADSLRPVRKPMKAPTSPAATSRPAGWLDAVDSQIALKPVTVQSMPALRRGEEVETDSGPYRIAKSNLPRERRSVSSRPAGIVKVTYRESFKKVGKVLRWLNETAYGISVLFLIAALVGVALQAYSNLRPPPPDPLLVSNNPEVRRHVAAIEHSKSMEPRHPVQSFKPHWLTTFGISGIVVLNLLRLVTGLANLVVIPFRKSPIQGVMFLIPPLTFVYLWQHWTKVRKPVGRVVGPVVTLALVVALYMFVPGFSTASKSHGPLENRVHGAVNAIKRDVTRSIKKTSTKVDAIKKDLPRQLDRVQDAAEGLKGQVEKAVEGLKQPDQDGSGKPQSPGPSTEKERP